MFTIVLSLLTSFMIVALFTPSLINIAIMKRLVDAPDGNRKLHDRHIPAIGGIAIFFGALFAYLIWFPFESIPEEFLGGYLNDFKMVGAALVTIFFLGLKDDIIGTVPVKKLFVHVVVAFILVIMADIRITGLYGIFGVQDIPYYQSVLLSVFTYTLIVNAFNLIDGVDGLAGGVGLISAVAFGIWFYLAGDLTFAVLAFSLAGSLLGFLIFNYSPARIFMGDSGSLTIGLVMAVLAIKLIEYPTARIESPELLLISRPIFVMAALVYPLVDTLRIFAYRIMKGLSPFEADKNHVHHRLLSLGLSHGQVSWCIYTYSTLIILLSSLWVFEPSVKLIAIAVIAFVAVILPSIIIKQIKKFEKA